MKHFHYFGFLLALALLAFAAGTPGTTSAHAVATAMKPTPTPTPVALQYDEIVRMVMPSSTAPPPGSFDESYRQLAAIADATPSPAPAHHGFPSFGGMIARGMMKHAMGGAASMQSMMAMMRDGTLERLTFYKNWVRTDLPLQHTATIRKCDKHETIELDLAKKTYRIIVDRTGCAGAPVAASAPHMPGNMMNMAPGTVDMKLSAKRLDLGPKELEGYSTQGSRTTISMDMTGATGSCHNGSSQMTIVRYISGIDKWHAYCPLPRIVGAPPTSVRAAMARGGCKPHFVRNAGTGAALANADTGSKLTLYRLMEMQSGSQGSIGSLLERGNIRWLYRPEAERLFSIPKDFTQARS
ncbi:MAG: hypothetical protein ACP5O6_07560 [Candidatus Baltobacteraceae bacterium]